MKRKINDHWVMKLIAFLAMLMLFCIPALRRRSREEAGEYEIYLT